MSRIINLLVVVIILSAAGMLLYPTVSDQYTQYQNARRILAYSRTAEAIDPTRNQEMLEAAHRYNEMLMSDEIKDAFGEDRAVISEEYRSLLDPGGDGIMGVIEIPRIGVHLPIYHGTEEVDLQRGAGHMEGTSLPVGGPGTHCGIAGHRGLPSARLFTDLDQMQRGDVFYITVLGELLVYQVDQVVVVLPHEMEYLDAVEGEDYCTLVTCTPYGINTHRLLVRGRRTELADISQLLAMGDGVEDIKGWQSAMVCAAPVALVGMLLMLVIRPKRRFR